MKARFSLANGETVGFRMKVDGYSDTPAAPRSGNVTAIDLSKPRHGDSIAKARLIFECGTSSVATVYLSRAEMDTLCVSWLSGLRDYRETTLVTCPKCDNRAPVSTGDPEKLEPQKGKARCKKCGGLFRLEYVIVPILYAIPEEEQQP